MKKWIIDGAFKALSDEEYKALSGEDTALYLADKQKSDIDTMVKDFNSKMDAIKSDTIKKDDVTKLKTDFETSLKALNAESFKAYVEKIEGLEKEVKSATDLSKEIKEIARIQGETLKKLDNPKIPDARKKLTRDDQLKVLIEHAFKSEAFEQYKADGFNKATGKMALSNSEDGKIELIKVIADADASTEKAVIPISSNHTGTVMISEISNVVRDDTPARKKHVRDLLNVGMTNQAQIVAGQVYDWTDSLTLGALMLGENTAAPESVFKSKENTWGLGRIANSMRISKRWFKTNGLQWVIDHVLAKLPDATYTVEDFQLLFGDDSGNNIQGLAGSAQSFDLTPQTYAALAFASVATWNSGTQTLVTFLAAHGMKNGDSLTIANATSAPYNDTHTAVEVVNAKQVIIDEAYVAEIAGNMAAWTGTSQSIFYHAIDGAQEVDVLSVVRALLAAGEFNATGHVVNPQQTIQMGLLKATDENYLNIQKDANGEVVGVGGLPIATTTAVPAGKFFSGDFSRNGAELLEYTPLSISFVEDVTTAKANEILVLIEEEIIFPIYNPYWFMYGKFADAKTQLETP